jgi:hypothetical protein
MKMGTIRSLSHYDAARVSTLIPDHARPAYRQFYAWQPRAALTQLTG